MFRKSYSVTSVLLFLVLVLSLLAACKASPAPAPAPAAPAPATATAKPTTAPAPTTAAPAPIVLRYGGYLGEKNPVADAIRWYAAEVEKRTNGRIKIETSLSGALGNANDLINLVGAGTIDISVVAQGVRPELFPYHGVFNQLVFVQSDLEKSLRAAAKIFKTMPEVQEVDYTKNNIVYLHPNITGNNNIITTKAIKTLADFKGLKIGAWGAYMPDAFKRVGVVPVSMANAGDVYDALAKGVIDGRVAAADVAVTMKWQEPAKNYIVVSMGVTPCLFGGMNLKKFNSLPADIQKIMLETGQGEEMLQASLKAHKDSYDTSIKTMEAAGVKVYVMPKSEMDAWKKDLPDYFSEWALEKDKAGFAGTKFMKLYSQYLAE